MIDNILFASSTGISLLTSKIKLGIIFNDDRCPVCGNDLELDSLNYYGQNVSIRYVCRNCTFVCPISHDVSINNIKPVYDNSIKDFFDNFGENIISRRYKSIYKK